MLLNVVKCQGYSFYYFWVIKGGRGVKLSFTQIRVKLSVIKPIHAKWIVYLYNTLKDDKEMEINGFRIAGTTEAIENAKDMVEKIENPFKEG